MATTEKDTSLRKMMDTILVSEGAHTEDAHCTLDADDQCVVCGVSHAEQCPTCGGRGFHLVFCPEII